MQIHHLSFSKSHNNASHELETYFLIQNREEVVKDVYALSSRALQMIPEASRIIKMGASLCIGAAGFDSLQDIIYYSDPGTKMLFEFFQCQQKF